MKTQAMDMTQGSLAGKMLRFSIPLALTHLLQVLFNLTDIAVVGRCCGPEALGAVGCTAIIVVLFTGFLIGIGSGVNVLVARYYGAKEEKNLRETVHTSLFVSLLFGVLLAIGCILFTVTLLNLLHTKPGLIDGATLYLRIYFLGMPAIALYNYGNGVLSAIGNTKSPLIYLMIAGALNVVLNLTFVLAFGMDVDGVACASVISQYVSAFCVIVKLFTVKDVYGLYREHLKITKNKVSGVLAIGIPSGLQFAIFQFANLFIQAGVNSFDETVVEGVAAASNADPIVYDIMNAFYLACASFIGQNYGAGKKDRIRKCYYIGLLYSFVAGLALGVLILLFGRSFLALFTSSEAILDAGMERLRIMCLSYCVSAFMDCTIAASRGLGKTVVPMIVVFLGSCVFRVIWVHTVFAYFHTITSLYFLYIFSWTITAIAEIIYFIKIYRKVPVLHEERSCN